MLERLVALLSWIRLFPDRLMGRGGGGGPCTTLSPGLRSGGLKSKFGRRPGHPGQESGGLVLLVPRVQARHVSLGHLAGHIDSRIIGLSGTACLRFSIVVRTGSGKREGTVSIAQLLLESRTGAYIDWLDDNLIRLIIIIHN